MRFRPVLVALAAGCLVVGLCLVARWAGFSSLAVVFPETPTRTIQVNATSRGMNPVSWAAPRPGGSYRLTAIATGGAKLRFQLRERSGGKVVLDTRELGDGEAATFAWPDQPVSPIVLAISGVGQRSAVRGELVACTGACTQDHVGTSR